MAPVRRLAERNPDLGGCEVVVLGLGVSGVAAVRLAVARNARVTAVDSRSEENLGEAAATVRSLGARLHAGGNPAALAHGADLVVVSPGVAADNPLVRRAHELGLPVWSEIELAARFCKGRVIGITGSNGKSTVTTMIGNTLRLAGIAGGTGGNLATPFADLLDSDAADACHAIELSSFQLETTLTLRADVALVLNLSPDHLDRHRTFEAYGQAKARLLELQTRDGHAVINADDPRLDFMRGIAVGQVHEFSTRRDVDRGAFVREDRIFLRTDDGEESVIGVNRLPLPGEHNLSNALAAALACRLAGCSPERIAEGLETYRALPHRLERVGTVRGVAFYNDSKATNPASTARAVTAFASGTVVLILGGRDKQSDWSELIPLVRDRVKMLMLVGEAAEDLARIFEGLVPISKPGTIDRAATLGLDAAENGDVVLLSPGCASFDQFRNFGERGEHFRHVVSELAAAAPGDPRG